MRDTGVPAAPGQWPRQPRPLLAPHSKATAGTKLSPTERVARLPWTLDRGRGLAGLWVRAVDVIDQPCSSLGGGVSHLVSPGHWRASSRDAQAPARDTEAGSCCQPAVPARAGLLWPNFSFPTREVGTITPAVLILGKFCNLFTVYYLLLSVHFKETRGSKGSPI